jgi:hypothetical protein
VLQCKPIQTLNSENRKRSKARQNYETVEVVALQEVAVSAASPSPEFITLGWGYGYWARAFARSSFKGK